MDLSSIQFPVYRLGTEKPQEEDKVLFYHRKNKEQEEYKLLVDDKNWHHSHLGQRRLKMTMMPNIRLFPIKDSIFFLGDLIKLSTPDTWFIDDNGQTFIYNKSRFVDLIIKPIKQFIPIMGGCIIELEGIETRFKCLYAPKLEKFAGVLKIGHSYILYGLYKDRPSDTRRKI